MSDYKENQYYEWKSGFRTLDREIDYFLKEFCQNRNCGCKEDECKHFKKKRKSMFGKRIDELYNMRLKIGLSTISEVINQN